MSLSSKEISPVNENILSYCIESTYGGILAATNGNGLIADRLVVDGDRIKTNQRTPISAVGLSFLFWIAARDIGYIGGDQAKKNIEQLLNTVSRLPRLRDGFFYTWYGTETERPVFQTEDGVPLPVVSSVDIAWFLAGLMSTGAAFPELKQKTEELIRSVPLMDLLDKKRRLFRGIYDPNNPTAPGYCYDTFLSEARIICYIAITKFGLDPEVILSLGRDKPADGLTIIKDGEILSWDGTALETFAPTLVVPEGQWSKRLNRIFHDYAKQMARFGWASPCEAPNGKYVVCGLPSCAINKEDEGNGRIQSSVAVFLGWPYNPEAASSFLNRAIKIPGFYHPGLGFTSSVDPTLNIAAQGRLAMDQLMIFLALFNLQRPGELNYFSSLIKRPMRLLLAGL